ncbi:Protein CBR-NHR-80 [Aphelenchoides bicaudatus]|nr:Protein CBR-NHR-80 [Aphelenchoides bicaudatus]
MLDTGTEKVDDGQSWRLSLKVIERILDIDPTYQCKICLAHATGFHFNAQSCGACAAFFRRAVVLSRTYRCLTGKNNCSIFYKNRSLCKKCRYEVCLTSGMSKTLVQIPKENEPKQRSYYTKSGLKRNKRFSAVKPPIDTPPSSTEKDHNENENIRTLESPPIVKIEPGKSLLI